MYYPFVHCFHGVEGFCLVCAKKLEQAVNWSPGFRRLHLRTQEGQDAALCGGTVGPEERFSTLASHSTDRFCQACLEVVYAQREAQRREWRQKRDARPFLEKAQEFNSRIRNPSGYDVLPLAFLAISFVLILLLLSGVALVFGGWESAGVIFLASGVIIWYFAVRAFG